jgi:glycosyltransferase involved in cell wall biosynthesis
VRTYEKRIAFVIASQHLIPHGGIGQFALGFTRMAKELNWKVDIITDKPPTDINFSALLSTEGARILSTSEPLSYNKHTRTFVFGDSLNFEKMANFRQSMMEAFSFNLYDAIVCNTYESMTAIYALDLQKYLPVIFYTHNESMIFRDAARQKNVFTDAFNTFFNKVIELPNIIVGTQTERNKAELERYIPNTVFYLPLPMPEPDLLLTMLSEQEGVLFIGRWEPGKNPLSFIDAVVKSGLKAKILTNSNGAKKFREEFAKLGYTNYEIGEGLVGADKIDFIRTSKVHYNTSLREAFGLGFFECVGHMHCVINSQATWMENFEAKYYEITTGKDAPELLRELHARDLTMEERIDRLSYVKRMHLDALEWWGSLIKYWLSPVKGSSSAAINKFTTVKFADYVSILDRGATLAVDDLKSVYANRHNFRVIYTDKDTYLTTDPDFVVPEETGSLENLFE